MKIKMTAILILMLCINFQLSAQYPINSYIQNNYEYDAYVLALREILSNPSNPDYNNPIIPTSKLTPYLEDLSAIYDNSSNNADIDLIFNVLDIHANQEYESTFNGNYYPIDFKKMVIIVNASDAWVQGFINTGVSGIAALDNLLTIHQFSIDSYFTLGPNINFKIETSNDYMNLNALVDDFIAIPEIITSYANADDLSFRFNYTGMPYELDDFTGMSPQTEPAAVSNIIVDGDNYIFKVYAGDCFAGCYLQETRTVFVDNNFNVLSNQQFEITKIEMYPNPATTQLNFGSNGEGAIEVEIYDTTGKLVLKSSVANSLNVSILNSGIYFVKLTQAERSTIKKLVIE